jgi:hypothetical protein
MHRVSGGALALLAFGVRAGPLKGVFGRDHTSQIAPPRAAHGVVAICSRRQEALLRLSPMAVHCHHRIRRPKPHRGPPPQRLFWGWTMLPFWS